MYPNQNIANSYLNKSINSDSQDPDNIIPSFSSNYYSIEEYKNLFNTPPNLHSYSPTYNNNHDLFSIFHCNVRSLQKQFSKDILISLENQISIIGISETRLNENSSSNIDLFNYSFLRHDSPTQAGGVGLDIHNSLEFHLRQDIKLLVDGCENLWVEIHTPKNEKNIIVGIIYRHPHSNISAFKDALSDKLEHTLNENKQLNIIGDINIDLIKCETHQLTSDYLDMIYSNSCFPVITQPTRVTNYTETLINHIYTNVLNKPITSGICMTKISDHFPVFLILHKIKSATKRNMKKRIKLQKLQ
jgi:hypothetical protein